MHTLIIQGDSQVVHCHYLKPVAKPHDQTRPKLNNTFHSQLPSKVLWLEGLNLSYIFMMTGTTQYHLERLRCMKVRLAVLTLIFVMQQQR
jgi:hypothetical protein